MAEHSQWSASKFAATIASPGLTALDQLYEEGDPRLAGIKLRERPSNVYAAEGTLAHLLLKDALTDGVDSIKQRLGETVEVDGFEIEVGQEMLSHVLQAVANVVSFVGPNDFVMPEQRVDYSSPLDLPAGEAWGTSDVVILHADGGATVYDFKYGKGIVVGVEDNPQLSLYALGAVEQFGTVFAGPNIRLVIDQPRAGGLKVWETTTHDLAGWCSSVALPAVRSVLLARQTFKSLDDVQWMHAFVDPFDPECRWSPWLPLIPTAVPEIEEMMDAADPSEFGPQPDAQERHYVDLSGILPRLDGIETWIAAVREEAMRQANEGTPPKGYKLVLGRPGNRTWDDPGAVEDMLKSMNVPQSIMYTSKLATPAVLEKQAKAGTIGPKKWARLEARITRPDGAPVLVSEDDPRPPITTTAAVDEFKDESAGGLA